MKKVTPTTIPLGSTAKWLEKRNIHSKQMNEDIVYSAGKPVAVHKRTGKQVTQLVELKRF